MRFTLFIYALVALCIIEIPARAFDMPSGKSEDPELLDGKVVITRLKPQEQDGGGYKLVYVVDVPLEVFWKFKTDFDNDFLTTNKFIISHRLIRRRGNVVVTEDRFSEDLYTHRPRAKFRWQTTLSLTEHRMDFVLLNPEECGQKYHYGHIQIEPVAGAGGKTKVTQVAYFDFSGVFFWINYPWYGGMKYFLNYTARWEQGIVLQLKAKYIKKSAQ